MASSGSSPAPPSGAPAGAPRPPRIGLTTYLETASWGHWHRPAAMLPASYVAAVAAAGGVPVMLPPASDGAAQAAAVEATLDGIDALLLAGGEDLDPAAYGQPPHPQAGRPNPARDRWERDLLAAAIGRDLPVLAVCRGHQLLNVALGGSLHQHLPELCGSSQHCPVPGTYGQVRVALAPGSAIAGLLDPELKVPCHHHQAIDALGDGLTVTGRADDGVIEAVELPGASFVHGVQWHPEDGDDPRLFRALVEAARP